MDLVDSSYDILDRIHNSPQFGGAAGIVPSWIALDPETGELQPAAEMDGNWSQFNASSSRVLWRLALDWLWFTDNRAKTALDNIALPYQQLNSSQRLVAAYGPDGQPAADYESLSMYATSLAGVLVGQNRDLALSVFATRILHAYHDDGTDRYWGDPDNLDDQNWGWFSTALVDGGMANLSDRQPVVDWSQVLP